MPTDVSGKARDALEAYREATAGEDQREAVPGREEEHEQMDGRRRNPYELTEETPVYVIWWRPNSPPAPADPASVRPPRPRLPGPRRPGRALLGPRHRTAPHGAGAVQDEGINLAGISASSSWRTRWPPSSPASRNWNRPWTAPLPRCSSARPRCTPRTAATWSRTRRSSRRARWSWRPKRQSDWLPTYEGGRGGRRPPHPLRRITVHRAASVTVPSPPSQYRARRHRVPRHGPADAEVVVRGAEAAPVFVPQYALTAASQSVFYGAGEGGVRVELPLVHRGDARLLAAEAGAPEAASRPRWWRSSASRRAQFRSAQLVSCFPCFMPRCARPP